jgi:anti-anti-sigma regulatory factor
LTIDLSAVTHLGSAGVSALAAARDRARSQGGDFVLVAPPGSPAHHVLSLVQIPVVTGETSEASGGSSGEAEDIFAAE